MHVNRQSAPCFRVTIRDWRDVLRPERFLERRWGVRIMPRIVGLQKVVHARPVDGEWHPRRRGENNICPLGFHYLQPFVLFEVAVMREKCNYLD
jgi:hypothetical protein